MKTLTVEVKQALLAPFQAAEIRVRTQPYTAAYVTARAIMTRLDEVIPWQWSFHLKGDGWIDPNGVMHQDGYLLIHGPEGQRLEFHDRGSATKDGMKEEDGQKKVSQTKQAKAAVSDCLKRCAVQVGVGRYLYELSGVSGGRIPKAGLEKALAAVGYRGPWNDRHFGPIGGIREADQEDEDDGESSSSASLSSKLTDDQRSKLLAAVERSGGKTDSTNFRGWLGKHTRNHTTVIEEILGSDVEELLAKLEALAVKKRAA